MIDDHLKPRITAFNNKRTTQPFNGRFPDYLRAVVVDTNDPLNIGRVRFRCPELHDKDMAARDCPWAEPVPDMGGPNAGDWKSPAINDIIFIAFEKGDARAPIYVGAADATRRRNYPLESVHIETPFFVDAVGSKVGSNNPPKDFDEDYLPKDGRPMSRGWKDRYGNYIIFSSVGYFPSSHEKPSTPLGTDPNANTTLNADKAPEVNAPDVKHVSIVTKLGHICTMSDVGYDWKKASENSPVTGPGSDTGEFTGDFYEDEEYEVKRHKFIQKLINENASSGVDQRRLSYRTRAGHYFEMRDVGWNKSRAGEYTSDRRDISSSGKDQRWIKIATKGGHLLQLVDIGFDPENDNYYNRNLLEEVGPYHEEDELSDDARQIRMVTRYGFKLALDDRGSSDVDAEGKETPRGNGFLIKGRRTKTKSSDDKTTSSSSSSGSGHGFGLEFNEKDPLNSMKMYTPNDQVIELNDKEEFVAITTSTPHEVSRPRQGLKNNEFALSSARQSNNDEKTFHIILDKKNEYSRVGTPADQTLELRDKEEWSEYRDSEDRGIMLSKAKQLAVFRSKIDAFVMVDDSGKQLIIQNNEGKIQIYCSGPMEFISDDRIDFKANKINFRAKSEINITSSGISGKIANGAAGFTGDLKANNLFAFIPEGEKPAHVAGKGIAKASPVGGATPNPEKIEKTREDITPEEGERGKAPNMPSSPVDESVVNGS